MSCFQWEILVPKQGSTSLQGKSELGSNSIGKERLSYKNSDTIEINTKIFATWLSFVPKMGAEMEPKNSREKGSSPWVKGRGLIMFDESGDY